MTSKLYPREHVAGLDGLRAYAALAVLAYHTNSIYAWFGWCGVQLFFVLSGFLITGILLQSRDAANYFSVFYVRRLLRIFPAYFLLLVVCGGIALYLQRPVNDFWLYVLYIQNFKLSFHQWVIRFPEWLNHTWSLAIEEQFYLFYPFIIKFTREIYLVPLLVSFLLLAIGCKYFLSLQYPKNPFVWANTVSNLDLLCTGALLAMAIRKYSIVNVRNFLWGMSIAFVSVYCLVLKYFLHISCFLYPFSRATLHGQFFLILLMPLCALLITTVCESNWKLTKLVFENKVVVVVGKISYGLYLYHFPIFILTDYLVAPLFPHWMANYGVVVVEFFFTLIFALFSWHLMEKKWLGLKRKWQYIPKNVI